MAFLIVSVIIFNLVAYFIPKRISNLEIYTTVIFALLFNIVVDDYTDLMYDFYGYFKKGVDWEYLILFLGLFPAGNVVFLNYYPFKKNIEKKIIYTIGWTAFLVVFEWASLKAGYYYYYNSWKLWYSALLYPFILTTLALNLTLIRKLNSSS